MAFYKVDKKITVAELLPRFKNKIPHTILKKEVADLAYDARSFKRFPGIKKGIKVYISPYPFVNRNGREQNPNLFIDEAVTNGARVVIYKEPTSFTPRKGVVYISVEEPRAVLADAAFRFYGINVNNFPIFGVTGTKGKTTTASILHHCLNEVYSKTGLLCTADYKIGTKSIENISPTVNDTWLSSIESLEAMGFIAELQRQNGKAMVVEATSHALELQRVSKNTPLTGGIITNLSSEHLDFHLTMAKYRAVKAKIIKLISASKADFSKILILNANDPEAVYFARQAQRLNVPIQWVRINNTKKVAPTDYQIFYERSRNYYTVEHKGKTYKLPAAIDTAFNAQNVVMAIALIHGTLHLSLDRLYSSLSKFTGVPGRLQYIQRTPFSVIVDYAHEELSLKSILTHAKTKKNRIVILMSCTGDRDKRKRPNMGKIAAKLADYTIITNDSTHTEEPMDILHQIEKGYKSIRDNGYSVIDDRKEAIKYAIKLAKTGDSVYILGMGSEKILDRGGKVIPWSDAEIVQEFL